MKTKQCQDPKIERENRMRASAQWLAKCTLESEAYEQDELIRAAVDNILEITEYWGASNHGRV